MKSKKVLGFTLIELLIVIAIIGILAVAFLPSLLNAPAKGRDTQRIADLQKIQKVLVSKDLEGKVYPSTSGKIEGILVTGWTPAPLDKWSGLAADFGGAVPSGPQEGETYYYYKKDQITGYSFGLIAKMETAEAGNTVCDGGIKINASTFDLTTQPTDPAKSCYVILMK